MMRLFRKRESPQESESIKALAEARENLQRTKERNDEVMEVACAMRMLRERNHFAERLKGIMEGGM